MSIKCRIHVEEYVGKVIALRAALANLAEFVDTLPAPDEDGALPSLDYGHFGAVLEMHKQVSVLSSVADRMYSR